MNPWIAVKFHSERTSGEVAEKLPGKFGELPGPEAQGVRLGGPISPYLASTHSCRGLNRAMVGAIVSQTPSKQARNKNAIGLSDDSVAIMGIALFFLQPFGKSTDLTPPRSLKKVTLHRLQGEPLSDSGVVRFIIGTGHPDPTLESASPSPPQGSIWHRFNIDLTLIRHIDFLTLFRCQIDP